ncbi:MAG TPA: hypothetical protein PK995_07955 [Bacteroidia bacterium]|nr:hypothetical protein [Bacteroidia bacterium]
MRITIMFIYLNLVMNLFAQNFNDFLSQRYEEEKRKGGKNIVLKTTYCHGCLGYKIYECFIIIEDTVGDYKIRYIKYKDGKKIKVLKDKKVTRGSAELIFKFLRSSKDTLFREIKKLDNLLIDTVYENGHTLIREIQACGNTRILKIFYEGEEIESYLSDFFFEKVYYRAYYYWLLNSILNNYIEEYIREVLVYD